MYSVDINFLKDRPEYSSQVARGSGSKKLQLPLETKIPLYVGVGVGLFVPAVVGGLWFFLQQQTAALEQRQAALDAQLGNLQKIDAQIKQINDETNQATEETKALATVFNQIKPWSAILQEIRERIPPGVQIQTIQQSQVAASPPPSPSPSPSPSPNAPNAALPSAPTFTTRLAISGTAASFNAVNDFLLSLQRSRFFKADETQLVNAALVDNPTPVEIAKTQTQEGAKVTVELPKVVNYNIQTSLSDVPASELLRELERKGAVGLVTRIRTLQDKGLIQR